MFLETRRGYTLHTFIIDNFSELSLLLHRSLLLQVPMIRHIRDIFRILSQSKGLWIVRYLNNFTFVLFEFRMILHIGLNFRILSYSLQFRSLSYCRCFGLWYVSEMNKCLTLAFDSKYINVRSVSSSITQNNK